MSYYRWIHTQACLNYELLQMDPHTGVSRLMILYVHTEACEVNMCVCMDSVSAS